MHASGERSVATEGDREVRRAALDPPLPARRAGRGLRDFPLTRPDVLRCVAAYVVFTAVGVGVGFLITHPLRHSWLQRTDVAIERWLVDRRTPGMDAATRIGSLMADTAVKVALTAVVVTVMLAVWRRWLEPLMVVLALIIEASAFITITWIVGRPRPDVPRLEESPVDSSFPSGHVAAAVVYGATLVVMFWHTRARWARVLGVVVVALVAAKRRVLEDVPRHAPPLRRARRDRPRDRFGHGDPSDHAARRRASARAAPGRRRPGCHVTAQLVAARRGVRCAAGSTRGRAMTHQYHEGQRELQDRFDTRRLADRLAQAASDTFSERPRPVRRGLRHVLHRHHRCGGFARLLLQGW